MSLVFMLLLSAAIAYADGVYFPDRAFRKLPEISSQRAIISHKEGVETLIVESALNAEGESFGWIIPLPSEPVEFRKVPTELLNVFSNNLEPEIIHESITGPLTIFFLVTVLSVFSIFFRVKLSVLLSILIILFFCAVLIGPNLGSNLGTKGGPRAGKAIPVQGVEIRKHLDIGSYEVIVIKAASTGDINNWLDKNEFAQIPPAGISIVNDYIKQNWVFVASKLKRKAGGLSAPHPMLLKFPVSKPVYPMRLTSLAGSDIFLRLFVVGNQRAVIDASGKTLSDIPAMEVADQYLEISKQTSALNEKYKPIYKTSPYEYPVFKGGTFNQIISHPFAQEIIWSGSIVTSFAGKVTPAQMENDYHLSYSPFEKFRRKYYSTGGAIATVVPYALGFWCLGLMVASLMVTKRGRFYVFTRILLPFFCLCVIGAGTAYSFLPRINVSTVSYRNIGSNMASLHIGLFRKALEEFKDDTGGYPTTAQGLDALIRDPGVNGWNGPYLKQLRREIPKDPWNNPYYYQSPGQHAKRNQATQVTQGQEGETYDLFSYGEDNEPGGAGASEDITNWK